MIYSDPDGEVPWVTIPLLAALLWPHYANAPAPDAITYDGTNAIIAAIIAASEVPASPLGIVRRGVKSCIVAKEAGKGTQLFLDALKNAKPTSGHPSQLMYELEDGTRLIFRKDFSDKAHSIGGPFQGQGKIDHYNVQVQNSSGKTIENVHVVPDGKGGYTWWRKDGVIKP